MKQLMFFVSVSANAEGSGLKEWEVVLIVAVSVVLIICVYTVVKLCKPRRGKNKKNIILTNAYFRKLVFKYIEICSFIIFTQGSILTFVCFR